MNVTWSNSLGKVAFFCFFCGIQILKVTYFSYLGKVFESLTNKSQNFRGFKKTRRFRVFVLRYRANSKAANDGKLLIWLNLRLFYCGVCLKLLNTFFVWKSFFGCVFCFWRSGRINLATFSLLIDIAVEKTCFVT